MSLSNYVQPMYQSHGNDPSEVHRQPRQPSRQARQQRATGSEPGPEPTSTFLRPDEIHSLTDRTRRHAQVKVLRSMGIEHKVRPDGGIAVLRAHITKVFDGIGETASRKHQKTSAPNWLAI